VNLRQTCAKYRGSAGSRARSYTCSGHAGRARNLTVAGGIPTVMADGGLWRAFVDTDGLVVSEEHSALDVGGVGGP